MFPKDEAGFGIDDQYYIGSSGLLVKPVTEKGAKESSVYLAEDQVRPFTLYFPYTRTHLFPLRSTTITSPTMLTAAPAMAAPSLSLRICTRSRSSCVAAP